tara:strand:+ start:357 stop:611 length:255 start_codon:yes stop_codon:yes gene_type:complete
MAKFPTPIDLIKVFLGANIPKSNSLFLKAMIQPYKIPSGKRSKRAIFNLLITLSNLIKPPEELKKQGVSCPRKIILYLQRIASK